MTAKVALITGASRGIGKATALAFADAGFDVAITARTLVEGERYEHSSTVKSSDTSAMPGSLEITARLIEERGQRALPIRMDLLEPETIAPAAEQTEKHFGQIDVLINNAVYTGPGVMDRFLDLPLEMMDRMVRANLMAQLQLTQSVLPGMLARGSGVIINVTTAACMTDPPAPTGEGGWGFAYAASKAAFHRLAGVLRQEHADSGVQFFNLEPGVVATEMMELQHGSGGAWAVESAPVTVPAAVMLWLATSPDAGALERPTLHAQPFARKHNLVPDWP
jgi:NAD(P)-dependent dehydrogenase (short-subunit alcohol dehydrogenase family)